MTEKSLTKTSAAILSPEAMINNAIEKGLDVKTIEKLLDMRDRLKAEQDREAFFKALSLFHAECPIIEKTREVRNKPEKGGGIRYRYATLDDIVRQVSPILTKHGLSYTIKSEYKDGFIIASCEVHHEFGHVETSVFPVPIEEDAFMNNAQKSGSALTYSKRYAFCNAFGILTSDTDDDGNNAGNHLTPQELWHRFENCMQATLENFESIQVIKDAIGREDWHAGVEAWCELTEETQLALWVAPKKGGPFTTDERKAMKAPPWAKVEKAHKTEQSQQAAKDFGLPDDYGEDNDRPTPTD